MNLDKPNLTEDQKERLAILSEECAEVIQMINKIFRFGFESVHPFNEDKLTNKERLENEIRDTLVAILLLIENNDLERKELDWEKQYAKRLKMKNFLNGNYNPLDVKYEFKIKRNKIDIPDDVEYKFKIKHKKSIFSFLILISKEASQ
jgi:NTP pyrophosphatase (non-canonical NTP hydrolase)